MAYFILMLIRYLLFGFLVSLLFGCKTEPTKPQVLPKVGEVGGAPKATPTENLVRQEVPTVTLVLGPGGAKSLAHAGVIKALQERRIPIARVVGIEWGALIAGLFAAQGQHQAVEWKLYKLDQLDLTNRGGFFGFSRDRTIKPLEGFLKDNFGSIEVANLKVPFACPSRSFWTGAMVMQKRGAMTEVLRKCLPFPGVFEVDTTWFAAATHSREVVESLVGDPRTLVVFVDVLGSSGMFSKERGVNDPLSVLFWQDVQRSVQGAKALSGEVIQVSTDGFLGEKFDSRKELFQLGEQEGIKAAQRLATKYGY